MIPELKKYETDIRLKMLRIRVLALKMKHASAKIEALNRSLQKNLFDR